MLSLVENLHLHKLVPECQPFWVLLQQEMMEVAMVSAGALNYANHLHLAAVT